MSADSRGRIAPSPPPPFPGKPEGFAGDYRWMPQHPEKLQDNEPQRTLLADLIALYAVDNQHEIQQREALSDEVWSRYFYTDSRDPELRELQQNAALSRAALAHEQHRFNSDLRIIDDLRAQPGFIRKQLLARIEYLTNQASPQRLSRYLREVVAPVLKRLDAVRDGQMSASFRYMASREGIDGLLYLPAMNQQDVKQLAVRVSALMDICLAEASDELMTCEKVTSDDVWQVWQRVATEALSLDVVPHSFEALRPKKRRRKEIPYDLIPGSLTRLLCANWWYRKLWQLRNEWREEQLRAACLVSKKASPYISHEAVIHKREQRRKALEFFRAHELVSDDGDTIDMETVVNASASNPAHRRNEMMACVKGMELIAEMRNDCAVFYTITCPSKFHATLSNGKPNPSWSASTVRQSSNYLVNVFASFRKAMHRAGLRWYGLRVAEPHHDGTVHWHLLCFMRKKDRRRITALLRKFAIREDRAELGKDTGPRFKSELINPRKGSPTSYIAKYVSKNIDGRGLSDVISKETGRSLRDTAEHVTAWASLHRVQQFRFFGIPSRQAYRELRLFANQAGRSQPDKKKGEPVLAEPRIDAVLAAADVGCFATYITKQGGVLVPRDTHLVRTAYELSTEPGTYGDHGVRIYGFRSYLLNGRVCTHATRWKMVKKAPLPLEASADEGGPAAPWTRGNNCPLEEYLTDPVVSGGEFAPSSEVTALAAAPDFENMTRKERRELRRRLKQESENERMLVPVVNKEPPEPDPDADQLFGMFNRLGLKPKPWELKALLSGARVSFGEGYAFRFSDGRLIYLG